MFLLGACMKMLEKNLQLTRGAGTEVSPWHHFICHLPWHQVVGAPWPNHGSSSRRQWTGLDEESALPTKSSSSPLCINTMARWEAAETHRGSTAASPWQPAKIRAPSGKRRDFKFSCSQELLPVSDGGTSASLFQNFSSTKTNGDGCFCKAQTVLASLYCWFMKNKWD